MPSLTEVRDAAVALLQVALPDVSRVEAFSGEVSLDAIAGKRVRSGVSVFVAALEATNGAEPGSLDFDMAGAFGVLVVSSNATSTEASEADALAAAEKAALAIHGTTFGLPGVGRAIVRSLESVTDDELVKNNITVWSVLWQQALVFGV